LPAIAIRIGPTLRAGMVGSMGAWTVEARAAAALAAIGAWTAIVPYLGKALGFTVDVAASVEIVDHVVPGLITAVAGSVLFVTARRGPLAASRVAPAAAGLCFLAGFWILATHVPLLGDAADDRVSWGAAIWHSVAALPIFALALWCVVRSTAQP
jgi:hypothetical protein